jgi:hypothetical protein
MKSYMLVAGVRNRLEAREPSTQPTTTLYRISQKITKDQVRITKIKKNVSIDT